MADTSQEADGPDKRQRERLLLNLPLQVVLAGGDFAEVESAITRDISSHGIYCFLRRPLQRGLRVELNLAAGFRLKGRKLPRCGVPARVVRTERYQATGMHGVGLQFDAEIPFFEA